MIDQSFTFKLVKVQHESQVDDSSLASATPGSGKGYRSRAKSDIAVPFTNLLPQGGMVNPFFMPTVDTGFGHFSSEYPKDDPDTPVCPPAPTLKRPVIDTRSAVELTMLNPPVQKKAGPDRSVMCCPTTHARTDMFPTDSCMESKSIKGSNIKPANVVRTTTVQVLVPARK